MLSCSESWIFFAQFKPLRGSCNFPVILLAISGARFEISIAVFTGSVCVTSLLTLDISSGFYASRNILRLARVFAALSKGFAELRDYYATISVPALIDISAVYPNPTLVSDSNSNTSPPKLTYHKFISRSGQPTSSIPALGYMTTAIYSATLHLADGDIDVVVKFTTRYNEDAHHLLVETSLAPRPYHCLRVVGDVCMVVQMDYVKDAKSVWQLLEDRAKIDPIVLEKVEVAVKILHQNDIVFGELRDANVLFAPLFAQLAKGYPQVYRRDLGLHLPVSTSCTQSRPLFRRQHHHCQQASVCT